MKEFSQADLEATFACSSAPTGPALPRFDDWVAEWPELWSAGRAVQREMFSEMLRARCVG